MFTASPAFKVSELAELETVFEAAVISSRGTGKTAFLDYSAPLWMEVMEEALRWGGSTLSAIDDETMRVYCPAGGFELWLRAIN